MIALVLLCLLAVYLCVYFVVFLSVFERFDRHESDTGNSLSAALISLFWPVWLPVAAVWWAIRARRATPETDGKAAPETEVTS